MPLYERMNSEMPAELARAAADTDAAVADELGALIPPPESPYNVKTLNALASAVADAARVMELDVEPVEYTEPAARLEPELVRMLSMLAAAADDYGQPLPVRLEDIRGDRELTAITAALIRLAKDEDFKRFLDMPADGAEVRVDIEMEEPEAPEGFDFARRMRLR